MQKAVAIKNGPGWTGWSSIGKMRVAGFTTSKGRSYAMNPTIFIRVLHTPLWREEAWDHAFFVAMRYLEMCHRPSSPKCHLIKMELKSLRCFPVVLCPQCFAQRHRA